MQCEYCDKQMPESYSYEVGGVVECNECFKKRNMTIEDELRARIAELEGKLKIVDEMCITSEVAPTGDIRVDINAIACVQFNNRIADLEQQLAEAKEIMSICEQCMNDGKGWEYEG